MLSSASSQRGDGAPWMGSKGEILEKKKEKHSNLGEEGVQGWGGRSGEIGGGGGDRSHSHIPI